MRHLFTNVSTSLWSLSFCSIAGISNRLYVMLNKPCSGKSGDFHCVLVNPSVIYFELVLVSSAQLSWLVNSLSTSHVLFLACLKRSDNRRNQSWNEINVLNYTNGFKSLHLSVYLFLLSVSLRSEQAMMAIPVCQQRLNFCLLFLNPIISSFSVCASDLPDINSHQVCQ